MTEVTQDNARGGADESGGGNGGGSGGRAEAKARANAAMGNAGIRHHISELVAQEHRLRADPGGMDAERRERLAEVETELDQCWDLLRQRAARQEYDQDPERARVRPARVVEHYES